MNVTTAKSTSPLSLSLLCVFFALPVFTALAADIEWSGAAGDGKWETGGNWDANAMPTDADTAVFPNSDTTVTITDDVKVSNLRTKGSSDATITLTGPGSLEITGDAFAQTSWTSANFVFDVDVVSTPKTGSTRWISLYSTNVYEKAVDATAHKLCIRTDSVCALTGNADVTAKYVNMVGSSAENLYFNNSLILSGNSKLAITGDETLTLNSGATLSVSDNAQLRLARDLTVNPGGNLVVSGNPTINHRKLTLPFSPDAGVSDAWSMNGGTFCATNDSSYHLYLPYTNAVKTLSGTGTFHMYRFYITHASNLTVRLNGPDVYLRQFSGGKDNSLCIGNGSTFGLWGNDFSFSDNSIRLTVEGQAVIDTTDYQDGVTGRNLTLHYLNDNSSGVLTVKGCGTCTFAKSHTHPNLGITGTDDSSIVFNSYPYALGDIVLHDSSKMSSPGYYFGHRGEADKVVKSLTMDGGSSLLVGRYAIFTGDVTLSGNANAVIQNKNNETGSILTCDVLTLSDSASLSVTGTIAATSLAMSGNAHLAFTAGTAFEAGAAFGAGNWTMEITIPSGYEAGIRPVVKGANFGGDFAEHVTLLGDTTGWSARTIDGNLVLYKESPPSGIEWIGKSTTSDNWSDAANWNDGNVPTAEDIVAFGGLDRPTPYNDSVGTVSGLVFRASAGPFTLSGADTLVLTATCGGRGSLTADNASIASHSSFDQTIESFVNFGGNSCGVVTDGGGALKLLGGFTATEDWKYFVVCGDVRVNGTCSVGIVSFKTSTTAYPSCLRVLSGGSFTIRNQYIRGLTEGSSYIGRIVVEEGASMSVHNGNCVFWYGELENVIDGSLAIQNGKNGDAQLVAGRKEQYYVGKGTIYADSARSAWQNDEGVDRYINFGGTLKLYMNGNWYTATYRVQGSEGVVQDPNCPTRFRMTDGTTLGATADWTYGPAADAYDVIANELTPAARASIMVGTVTVNTQNPTNDTAHTITFIDPLDASAANLVKVGAGTLAFNEPAGYPSQISNLTVNAGVVQFAGTAPMVVGITANAGTVRFAAAPTLSGSLTIASTDANFCVDRVAETMDWEMLATAAEIVGPNGETKWRSATGMRRFKITSEGTGKALYGSKASGFTMVVR